MTEPTDAIRAQHVPRTFKEEEICSACSSISMLVWFTVRYPCDVVKLAEAYVARLAEAQQRIADLENLFTSSHNRATRAEARLAEVSAALDSLVWVQSARYTLCRLCGSGYPKHENDCPAEAALAKAREA